MHSSLSRIIYDASPIMISTAHRHYPPMFGSLPSDLRSFPSGLASSQRIQTSGLEPVGDASPYSLHSFQPISLSGHAIRSTMKSPTKTRHHPYEPLETLSSKAKDSRQRGLADDKSNAPVRRRISRACDQCNQLRTKCDGRTPCAHCIGELLGIRVLRTS